MEPFLDPVKVRGSARRRKAFTKKPQAGAPPSDIPVNFEAEKGNSSSTAIPSTPASDADLEMSIVGQSVKETTSDTTKKMGGRTQHSGSSGITLDDLMVMIKDAQKNILLLNRVRTRALEELDSARTQNEALQGQVKVLQARLAEADAKLNLTTQTKVKNRMLQEQLQELQEKSENLRDRSSEVQELQESLTSLEARLSEAESKGNRLAQVEGENRTLEEQMTSLQKRLAEKEEEAAKAVETSDEEKVMLREQIKSLQEKMQESEMQLNKAKEADEERAVLEIEVKRLKEIAEEMKQVVELKAEEARTEFPKNDQLEEQVKEDETSVSKSRRSNVEVEQQLVVLRLENEQLMKDKNDLEQKLAAGLNVEGELSKVKAEKSVLEKRIERLKLELGGTDKRNNPLRRMQLQLGTLQKQLAVTIKKAAQVEQIETEKNGLLKAVEQLQKDLDEERRLADEVREQAEAEGDWLREHTQKLQERLDNSEERTRELEVSLRQLEELGMKGQLLEAEVEMLKKLVEQGRPIQEAAQEMEKQNRYLKERVQSLEEQLRDVETERWTSISSDVENKQLQEQVGLLKQQLVLSDEELQNSVEFYRSEMEAFQGKLELLSSEISVMGVPVPVGDVPWEFWSGLLLDIDDLMLSKRLTKIEGTELRRMAWQRDSRIRDAYVPVQNEQEPDIVQTLRALLRGKARPGLHVVHIAAEMAPVAKVGGLADVVTGLGKALQKKGHLVEVVLPKYDCMDYSRIKGLKAMDYELMSYFDGRSFKNKVWRGIVEGLPVYFIEPLHPSRFFWRGTFYGEGDDFQRFTFFCRAALEFLMVSGKRPDVIHSHDWQTAVVAPLYWDVYYPQGFDSAKVAFTCHNFEYQGTDSPSALASCGLDVPSHFRQDRMQDNYMPDKVNLLKGGFVYSNLITTVSPTYAVEVRGPEGGRGLHGTLATFDSKFFGVLNGIDYEAWDPATDILLDHPYDSNSLDAKSANKIALRKKLGLSSCPDGDRPLVGCITRLVPQKGVHLIRHAIYRTRDMGGQFILLGSSPVPEIQRDFENMARQFENDSDVRLVLKYDEVLSHSIYAASDLFVIPSIFEPCGLTQLIAMRYGSIPVVRKTGGLADSVFDADDANIPEDCKNGFTFTATDEQGLNYALDRALYYYFNKPEWWQKLVMQTMRMDFSWEESSQRYVELYEKMLTSEDR